MSSSSSGSVGPGAYRFGSYKTYTNDVDGYWENFNPAANGWSFVLSSGTKLKDQWANIRYSYNGTTLIYTYHFDKEGVMDSGWFLDEEGKWYFLSTVHDGWFGRLKTGWHLDDNDGRWYYLNLFNGAMLTGWQKIDGEWYYMTQENSQQTWYLDKTTGKWAYAGQSGRPLGSLYRDEATPDGYYVDDSGKWTPETP